MVALAVHYDRTVRPDAERARGQARLAPPLVIVAEGFEVAAQPTAVDLFSGCGGGSIGLRAAGFRVVGAVELDRDAARSYERLMQLRPTVADVRDVAPRDVLRGLRSRRELTLLFGCPPCQSFSEMRRGSIRTGSDSARERLLGEYLRFVTALSPRHIAFENVPGLLMDSGGRRFDRLIAQLGRLGYRVAWSVLDAADFGVPQHRRRVVLLGSRVTTPVLPEPTHGPPGSRLARHVTVREAIGLLPHLSCGEQSPTDPMHRARRHSELVIRRLRSLGPGGSRAELPPHLQLRCHRDHDGHKDAYGRMGWDRPAPTLTTGCTNTSRGRFAHPEQDRAITPREALFLQSFPPDAVLEGGAESIASQIGNALPPKLAARIGSAVIDAESNEAYTGRH